MSDLTTAVEAGARAWFDRQQATRRDEARKRPDGHPWQWEDLTPLDQHAYRSVVLPIVTAALEAAEDKTPHQADMLRRAGLLAESGEAQ